MNQLEYFIFLPVKRFIAITAKIARLILPLIILLGILEPVLLLSGYKAWHTCGAVSDELLSIFIGILGIPFLWCHHVLLGKRGMEVTRFLAAFNAIMGFVFLVCSLYTAICGSPLLAGQHIIPIMSASLFAIIYLFNLHCLAAASLKLKLTITLMLLTLGAAILTAGILPLISLIFKILMAIPAYVLLKKLEVTAPAIISMPPLD